MGSQITWFLYCRKDCPTIFVPYCPISVGLPTGYFGIYSIIIRRYLYVYVHTYLGTYSLGLAPLFARRYINKIFFGANTLFRLFSVYYYFIFRVYK